MSEIQDRTDAKGAANASRAGAGRSSDALPPDAGGTAPGAATESTGSAAAATTVEGGLAARIAARTGRLNSRQGSPAAVSWIRQAALLPVLVVILIVGASQSSAFFTVNNLVSGVGQQVSALGVTVVGESLILLIGGMDLSLEATYGLAPMIAAWLIVPKLAFGSGAQLSPYLGILILLAIGAVVGLINGLLIVKSRLNGFIVTLGMTVLLAGVQNGVVHGQSPYELPSAFSYLGSAFVGQVPVSLLVAGAVFVLTGLFLRYHRTGRSIYAIGGNPEAARAAGIKVDRIKIGVYVAGSVLAAVGGLMEAGKVSSVTVQQGYQ
ncbi:ABC transporter permease, partial [Actinocrinis sp.]|uniref:ABC transporter permease n=1 Tax=Actinocrinis sp. TaxID=1920516 RepID=UPI002D58D1AB